MNRRNQDPHDPDNALQGIADEFWSRPDHDDKVRAVEPDPNWRPGDPMMTPGALAASWEHARKSAEDRQRKEAEDRQKLHEQTIAHDKKRRQTIRRRGLGAIGLTLVAIGIIKPGVGVIDQVQRRPAAEVVQEAVARRAIDDEATKKAYDTVLNIYQSIDKYGMKSVQQQAAAERASNPTDYISEDIINKTEDEIDQAETNERVQHSLAGFMREFNVEVSPIDEKIRLGDSKSSAEAVISVFKGLPKSLVKDSSAVELVSIVQGEGTGDDVPVEDGKKDKEKEEVTMGDFSAYPGEKGELRIMADGSQFDIANRMKDKIAGWESSRDHTVAHEAAHAFQNHNGVSLNKKVDDIVVDPPWTARELFGAHADMPVSPSKYAKTHPVEMQAEIMAGLFTDGDMSLKPPSHSRHFASELGKKQINELITLEKWHPGIALQLIAARK